MKACWLVKRYSPNVCVSAWQVARFMHHIVDIDICLYIFLLIFFAKYREGRQRIEKSKCLKRCLNYQLLNSSILSSWDMSRTSLVSLVLVCLIVFIIFQISVLELCRSPFVWFWLLQKSYFYQISFFLKKNPQQGTN